MAKAASALQKAFHTFEVLRTTARDAVGMENVRSQKVCSICGRGEIGEGDEMNSLGDLVNDGEYNCITCGSGQTRYEVHANV